MHEPFKINTGRDYHKRQRGLVAAIAEARSLAAQNQEVVTVYLGSDNYGYWCKPMANCSAKFSAVTAREVCYIRPDGSLAHVNRATVASTEAFIAAQIARIDAEQQANQPCATARALAATW